MLRDRFDRTLKSLRLSVTDRCNLRCRYCMPAQGVPWLRRDQILSLEEMARLAGLLTGLGITRIKLTGGEPLLRPDVTKLVAALAVLPGLQDLSMITNGLLLERHAQALADAGLKRMTVSLDSLNMERFRDITRGGDLNQVFRGLEAARKAGLGPLKINCVMLKANQDELLSLAALAREQPWEVRFIEYMPVTASVLDSQKPSITPSDLRRAVEERWGALIPLHASPQAPARTFEFKNGSGKIGFISSVSEPFCAACDRLRLGADGFLKLCMAQPDGADLLGPVRSGMSDRELTALIRQAAWNKPQGHDFYRRPAHEDALMSRMGG